MFKPEEVEKELSAFGKYVVKQAKTRLSKSKKKSSGNLYNSIGFDLKVMRNSFSMSFFMQDYGAFVDEGVRGNKSSSKGNRQTQSRFKFGTNSSLIGKSKGGMSGLMAKWAKKKGFQWRDKESGRFMSHKSMGYLIARSIYNKGLKPTLFFTKPFEDAFLRLPEDIIEKFGLDVDEFLEQVTQGTD